MATDVVMQVYVEDPLEEETLSQLRSELLRRYDGDEFYWGTPLVPVPREDYDLAGLEGEPGYLISVELLNTYYGVGYERGYLPLIIEVAEWLEERLPGCRIFYGHDCSGEILPFNAPAREKLMRYYEQVGHEPYRRTDLSHAEFQTLFGEARALYGM